MAASLLAYEVADLCLGKPPLTTSLPLTATVTDAISALKSSDEPFLTLWTCSCYLPDSLSLDDCRCVGKLCMADIICFLSSDHNLSDPRAAMKSPLSAVATAPSTVRHVQPRTSLMEAMEMMVDGAQNLVVPLQNMGGTPPPVGRRKTMTTERRSAYHKGRSFCWLTQEDVIRFLLGQMGMFSPIPAFSVHDLGVINTDVVSISYHSSAMAAIPLISRSVKEQTSVAVVDDMGGLMGEISPFTLAACDQTAACAAATLSAGEMMAYVDCGGPAEELVRMVKLRLRERGRGGMWSEFMAAPWVGRCSSSSDEEEEEGGRRRRWKGCGGGRWPSRIVRRSEGVVCQRGSSLAAVMVQAIVRRVSYVWVVEEDGELVGIVKFSDMLKVLIGRR